MNRRAPNVHIDRLDLDLRGVSPETARATLDRLGPALQLALARSGPVDTKSGPIRISRSTTANDLAALVATRLASVVQSQIEPRA